MFAAAPPLVGLLIRYWLIGEALKLATGTSKKELAMAALDLSAQIGEVYQARIRAGPSAPFSPFEEAYTAGFGIAGAPGMAAEALGFTFEGEFARQQQRLASEIAGGLPATRVRIKGAPAAAKRKLSTWNREIKKAYAVAKANKNQFGQPGKISVPKKAFPKIVKIVAAIRKGRKQKSTAGKQIAKALKKRLGR
jgi:hypothetical protein